MFEYISISNTFECRVRVRSHTEYIGVAPGGERHDTLRIHLEFEYVRVHFDFEYIRMQNSRTFEYGIHGRGAESAMSWVSSVIDSLQLNCNTGDWCARLPSPVTPLLHCRQRGGGGGGGKRQGGGGGGGGGGGRGRQSVQQRG